MKQKEGIIWYSSAEYACHLWIKATSIAHEMYNDRNSIDENVDYIIRALKDMSFGML